MVKNVQVTPGGYIKLFLGSDVRFQNVLGPGLACFLGVQGDLTPWEVASWRNSTQDACLLRREDPSRAYLWAVPSSRR